MMPMPDWLDRAAATMPQAGALYAGSLTLTYAALRQMTIAATARLSAKGIVRGDRVALLARNGSDFAVTVHALMRLGAILVPLNTRLTRAEQSWQLDDCQPTCLLYDRLYAERAQLLQQDRPSIPLIDLAEILPQSADGDLMADGESQHAAQSLQKIVAGAPLIDLDAPQAIIYTSGTTGSPKGAIITYGMQWWSAMGSLLNLGHRADDRWLAVLPFFHIGGLAILMRAVIGGTGVVILDHFDPAAANAAIRAHHITLASVVAVMLQRMLADLDATGDTLPSLRGVLLGGGPAPRPLLEAAARHRLPVMQTYGMTESCSQAVTLSPQEALRKLGSAGLPLAAVEVAIWCDGLPAASGVTGEIMLRGATITSGYWQQPAATAAAFHEGWFATGDLGQLDDSGYLTVIDRRSDLIISGGENVYPAEIEAALLAHPDVAEAGVCGLPDPTWGQVPVAAIVLHDHDSLISHDAVIAFLSNRLAKYKIPQRIVVVTALPRNAAGKVLRRELPSLFADPPSY